MANKYDYEALPQYVESLNAQGKTAERQIRALYADLRDIAQKRIKRGAEHDPFPMSKDLSFGDIRHELSDIARFLASKSSTAKGRAEILDAKIKSLHEHGYAGITKKNHQKFVDFLDAMEDKGVAKLYPSDALAETFEQSERLGISFEELMRHAEYFVIHRKQMESMPKSRDSKKRTAKYYRDQMEKKTENKKKTEKKKTENKKKTEKKKTEKKKKKDYEQLTFL